MGPIYLWGGILKSRSSSREGLSHVPTKRTCEGGGTERNASPNLKTWAGSERERERERERCGLLFLGSN